MLSIFVPGISNFIDSESGTSLSVDEKIKKFQTIFPDVQSKIVEKIISYFKQDLNTAIESYLTGNIPPDLALQIYPKENAIHWR